ncbi:MAG TPA: thermonuclease family protein [Alphaproteobacteria bacterium]|nr:thermonuclease family protein [Alphaproteobacteria bacterium]
MTRGVGSADALPRTSGAFAPRPLLARWLRAALISLAPFLVSLDLRAADVAVASGAAIVIDATHLEIAGRRFKLYGIDAPDIDEVCNDAQGKEYPCGINARQALADLVKGGSVSCLPRGPNESDEMLGVCSLGTSDLAKAIIDAGWAIAERTRTLYYEKAEEEARLKKQGLWQGQFVPPADWRIGERVPQSHTGNKENSPAKLF